MRIAIDARKLHDFGIGTYIRNLLRHLARIDDRNEYVLLCHQPDLDMAATLGPNFRAELEKAAELARQRGVFPGTARDLRRRYRLTWSGWDR